MLCQDGGRWHDDLTEARVLTMSQQTTLQALRAVVCDAEPHALETARRDLETAQRDMERSRMSAEDRGEQLHRSYTKARAQLHRIITVYQNDLDAAQSHIESLGSRIEELEDDMEICDETNQKLDDENIRIRSRQVDDDEPFIHTTPTDTEADARRKFFKWF